MGKLELFILNILATFRAVASKIISVEKKIDDLKIGGRNYFGWQINRGRYPGTEVTPEGWLKYDSNHPDSRGMIAGFIYGLSNINEIIEDGEEVILSLKMKAEGTSKVPMFYLKDSMHYYQLVGTLTEQFTTFYYKRLWVKDSSSISVHMKDFGSGVYYIKDIKLEVGNKATDWSPAFESIKSDWKETNEDAYSFIKRKPTHLSEFTNDLDHYTKAQTYSRNEALDKFIPKVGVVDIFDTKTFKSSPIVPNGTVAKHAVNLEQLQALKPHIGSNGNWFIGTTDTGVNATGNKGEKGDTGARGTQGLPGTDGKDGKDGAKGEKGDTGARGATGSKGDPGNDGLIPYVGSNGNWWIGIEDMGIPATGEKGAKGDTGARGAQGLPGTDGKDGAKGEKGDTGARGAQGLPGTDGKDGAKGAKGDTGARGAQGLPGTDGKDGAKGAKGDTGARGAQGLPGTDGKDGAKGEKGDTGARGLPGEKGERGERGLRGLPGEKGEPGDPASSTDTLDNVAQRNNRTTKPLIVEDEKQRTEQNPRSFHFYDKDGLIGQINAARDGAQGKSLSLSYDQYLRFRLREETTQLAGGYFLSRVSGHDALNATDFTTLRQLRSHNPEIVDTPEYSLVKKKDLIIATKESTVLTIPDIHPSEQEDWNGRRFKIVAHGQVKLTKPYKELSGKGESTNIEAGQSVELMFLNQQWYAI